MRAEGRVVTGRARADRLLVERGMFESRARAQAAIAAGLVRANGAPVRKPSDEIAVDAALEAAAEHPWVSRGGVKLAAALDAFGFDPAGRLCLDVGASTGGFTDVLLARGACRVFAVDVGREQLHPRLRGDPRLLSMESTDIRSLDPACLGAQPDLLVVDVSFISLKAVLPPAQKLLAPSAQLVALVKPQFEAERHHRKKGIVRDAAVRAQVCEQIAAFVQSGGWSLRGIIPSPIRGGDGNVEFLLGAARD
ncbi:MAG: TlyA family RNA methyltransferase [Variibacter sp.]|nr:TlyA family RNA methyltransferase [Variibacter sp.]